MFKLQYVNIGFPMAMLPVCCNQTIQSTVYIKPCCLWCCGLCTCKQQFISVSSFPIWLIMCQVGC